MRQAASTICFATSFSVTSKSKAISRKDAKLAKKTSPGWEKPGDNWQLAPVEQGTGRRSSQRARDLGGRGNRPDVLERVRAGVAAGRRSRQLFPVPSRPPVCFQCLDGSDHQSVHRADGAVCQTREGAHGDV